MNCRNVRNRFDELYRLGGRDPENAAWVHLSTCAHCSREFRRWQEIADSLKHTAPLDPPAAFAQKVMIAYEERQQRATGFHPLQRRFQQIAWAILVLVMLGGGVVLIQRSMRQAWEPRIARVATENVRFELAAAEASCVALVGDFNGWDRKACMLKPEKKGSWSIELQLSAGSYQYLFLIDNKIWWLDTLNVQSSPDGFGGMNSEITL
jgi:hypothetical protein